MYRFLTFGLYGLLLSAGVYAQQQEKVTVQHATVFENGAALENTAKISLPAGGGEVIFTNISGNIHEESINVGIDNNNILIQSVTYQKDFLEENILTPMAQLYTDSITQITIQKQQVENKLSIVNEQLAILKANEKVGGNNSGLNIVELQKMLDLVTARMGALLDDKVAMEAKIKKLTDHLSRLADQLKDEKSQPVGRLSVKFYTIKPADAKVLITYVANDAQWAPSYDIRADKPGDPLTLIYKGAIYQNTGVKWDNIHLTLSISNPLEKISAPVYATGYLSFYQPVVYMRSQAKNMKPKAAGNHEEVDHAPILTTDELVSMQPGKYTQIHTTALNTDYDIELPYTILSHDQEQLIDFNTRQVPATYRYYTYPKVDQNAFLQAQVTQWQDLTILPGDANIYYDHAFIGQSHIDAPNVTDTLTFSLGRDKKIIVKRVQDTKMRSTKTIGSNVKEQYGFTTTVRNTHTQPVDIVVADQVPVSTDKEISVEDIETSGGTYNETTGEVDWHITLNANEAKELKLGYAIKYPKGKMLNSH